MRNVDKNQEQAYQCQGYPGKPCGTVHWETTIAVRPFTKRLYCDQCQSEDIKLIVED